ncbi:MAG: hypothetical protein CM1200mP27_01090 [Chloroflexota bacterium]|nr:MAG: hypothetical protein CM1200mP27_01090 [Chloroflexota bacterium]
MKPLKGFNDPAASSIIPLVEPQPIRVTSASGGPSKTGALYVTQYIVELSCSFFDHLPALMRVGKFVTDQVGNFIVFIGCN